MKRILLFFLLALVTVSGLVGCTRTVQIDDLSRTSYIELRAHSSNGHKDDVDYLISDYEAVDSLCLTLQSLTLEKVRITEPLGLAYSLVFYDHAHREISSLLVVYGDYVHYKGDLYKITGDCDLEKYLDSIVSGLLPYEKGDTK